MFNFEWEKILDWERETGTQNKGDCGFVTRKMKDITRYFNSELEIYPDFDELRTDMMEYFKDWKRGRFIHLERL